MEPTTLKTLLTESDDVFSREIKAAICKEETQKMVEKLSAVTRKDYTVASPTEKVPEAVLSYDDIMSLLERNTEYYWMYDFEERMYISYDFEGLKEEVIAISGDEDGFFCLKELYFFTTDTWELLVRSLECLEGYEI